MAEKKANKQADNRLKNLGLGLLSLAVSYGFISWAIDSGSIWHYVFAFASFYYAVHFIKESIIEQITYARKAKKARRAKG